jgi:hypothetical protein
VYLISDQLFKNKAAIEQHIYERERSLFGLQETITMYDLTNTFFRVMARLMVLLPVDIPRKNVPIAPWLPWVWLKEHQYPLLVVSRKKHREFAEKSSVVVKNDDGCTVRV